MIIPNLLTALIPAYTDIDTTLTTYNNHFHHNYYPSRVKTSAMLPNVAHYPILTLLVCIALRIFQGFFVTTYFNPDEYWQNQEVAYNLVFNKDNLNPLVFKTWEWADYSAIRGYLHPMLTAWVYSFLQHMRWDTQWAIAWSPRILSCFIASIADYHLIYLIIYLLTPFISSVGNTDPSHNHVDSFNTTGNIIQKEQHVTEDNTNNTTNSTTIPTPPTTSTTSHLLRFFSLTQSEADTITTVTLLFWLFNWFAVFCYPRAFSNCIETSVLIISLCYWPFLRLEYNPSLLFYQPAQKVEMITKKSKNGTQKNNTNTKKITFSSLHFSAQLTLSLTLAALGVVLRPTSVIVWIPLYLHAIYITFYNVFTQKQFSTPQFLKIAFFTAIIPIFVGIIAILFLIEVDSHGYQGKSFVQPIVSCIQQQYQTSSFMSNFEFDSLSAVAHYTKETLYSTYIQPCLVDYVLPMLQQAQQPHTEQHLATTTTTTTATPFIFSLYNFYKVNKKYNIAALYGEHFKGFSIVVSIPVVMICLLPFLCYTTYYCALLFITKPVAPSTDALTSTAFQPIGMVLFLGYFLPLFYSTNIHQEYRFILPAVPFLYLLAAWGVVKIYARCVENDGCQKNANDKENGVMKKSNESAQTAAQTNTQKKSTLHSPGGPALKEKSARPPTESEEEIAPTTNNNIPTQDKMNQTQKNAANVQKNPFCINLKQFKIILFVLFCLNLMLTIYFCRFHQSGPLAVLGELSNMKEKIHMNNKQRIMMGTQEQLQPQQLNDNIENIHLAKPQYHHNIGVHLITSCHSMPHYSFLHTPGETFNNNENNSDKNNNNTDNNNDNNTTSTHHSPTFHIKSPDCSPLFSKDPTEVMQLPCRLSQEDQYEELLQLYFSTTFVENQDKKLHTHQITPKYTNCISPTNIPTVPGRNWFSEHQLVKSFPVVYFLHNIVLKNALSAASSTAAINGNISEERRDGQTRKTNPDVVVNEKKLFLFYEKMLCAIAPYPHHHNQNKGTPFNSEAYQFYQTKCLDFHEKTTQQNNVDLVLLEALLDVFIFPSSAQSSNEYNQHQQAGIEQRIEPLYDLLRQHAVLDRKLSSSLPSPQQRQQHKQSNVVPHHTTVNHMEYHYNMLFDKFYSLFSLPSHMSQTPAQQQQKAQPTQQQYQPQQPEYYPFFPDIVVLFNPESDALSRLLQLFHYEQHSHHFHSHTEPDEYSLHVYKQRGLF